MAGAKRITTPSTKGQVILPAVIRKRQHGNPGAKLTVEETPDGVLLKPAPLFAATSPDDVFGCLRHGRWRNKLSLPSGPDWAEAGLDLADALHRAAAQLHAGFVSFDKALASAARRLHATAVREP